MNLLELDITANYPIKKCPEGFEAQALLKAWTEQLYNLLRTPGVNLAEINACIVRLAQIAHEATTYSKSEQLNEVKENENKCTQMH